MDPGGGLEALEKRLTANRGFKIMRPVVCGIVKNETNKCASNTTVLCNVNVATCFGLARSSSG